MAEFQNLAKLLEAIKLTEAARDKLKDMQKRIDEAEADSSEKAEATTEFNKHTEELMELKIKEESYRTIARKHLVIDVEEVKTDEQPAAEVVDKGTVSTRPGSKSAMSFKLPQLEKFRRGENFSKFCEKFLEYVTLGNIGGENLPLIFLQLVDDFTKEKLKKINLTLGQSRDAKKFIDVYMTKMCPPHEGSTFRARLAEIKQKRGEVVDEFAYRIQETASRAFSDSQDLLREDACFSAFRKGLIDPVLKVKLHEDVTITTFEKAVEESSRLEGIRASLGMSSTTESTIEEHDVLALSTSETEHNTDNHEVSRVDERQDYHRNGMDNRQNNLRNNFTRRSEEYRNRQYQTRGQANYQPRYNTGYRQPQTNQGQYRPQAEETDHDRQRRESRPRQNGGTNRRAIKCYNCNGLNHIAKNCTASLNM